MATVYKTVTLRNSPNLAIDEALASGTITPGMLLEQTSATRDTVVAHNTVQAPAERMFALEDELQGKTVTDNYANGTIVFYRNFRPGDRVQALLADGYDYPKGTLLVSNGDGYLRPYVPVDVTDSAVQYAYSASIVGVVLEARSLAASGATDPNTCPIRVM